MDLDIEAGRDKLMNKLSPYDNVITTIADYVLTDRFSPEAYRTAQLALADSLGCAILSLNYPACTKLLGPTIPGIIVPHGIPIPATKYILEPIQAAFNIGTMIRWLDYNDTWLAKEWAHPSDNLGAILSAAYSQNLTVSEVLKAMIKAYEIQGVLAMSNSFNRVGLDHVILVKVASAAVSAHILGGTYEQICAAISNAWMDLAALRAYRHAPNTGSRKSWAAGDATSRGLQFALFALRGEMGYPTVLTAPKWGLNDVIFDGTPVTLERPLGSYVMENILFKIQYPAEFHAQTAVECAARMHPEIGEKLHEIDKIEIETHEAAIRIIDKKGPLKNPADRDHCLQYMIAVGLIYGTLTAEHYEEHMASDPLIDQLRSKMTVKENKSFTHDYLDPEKRSVANALTIYLKGGKQIGPQLIEYPLGHRRRREESHPYLLKKFRDNLKAKFSDSQVERLVDLFFHQKKLGTYTVAELFNAFTI